MTTHATAADTTHHGWTPSVQEKAEMHRIGTTFNTPLGPVAVEHLEDGDVVLDQSGFARKVVWVRETRQSLENIDYADAHSVMLDDGRAHQRTRFPGIRFVRGKPADAAFQILFRDLEDTSSSAAPFRHFDPSDDEMMDDVKFAAE